MFIAYLLGTCELSEIYNETLERMVSHVESQGTDFG